MAKVKPTKSDQDELERITNTVRASYEEFSPNCQRYHFVKNFVFNTALTNQDINQLKLLNKPPLEANVLESYLSRLRGEFSANVPSVKTRPAIGTVANIEVLDLVDAHLLSILDQANKDDLANNTYNDTLGGGFSAWKIYTEYESDYSFNQIIRLGRVYEPTLTVWDPTARLSHKGDGKFAGEIFPMTTDDVKRDYPQADIDSVRYNFGDNDFNWAYQLEDKRKILLLCNYTEVKYRSNELYLLSDGQCMRQKEYEELLRLYEDTGMIANPPEIIKKRRIQDRYIKRYLILGHQMLEAENTDFSDLPYIFVDGNSEFLKKPNSGSFAQMTRPYIYHSIGVQRFKNLGLQTYAACIENQNNINLAIPLEGIPDGYESAYQKPQIPNNLLYNATMVNEKGERIQLPPPAPLGKIAFPQEIALAYESAEKTIQNIQGSYDAALGINNNQLSGEAIIQGATQSNATAQPYLTNYLYSLSHALTCIVNLMPKYYKTPRTIPVLLPDGEHGYIPINQNEQQSFDFETNTLQVRVTASASFKIQQQRAFQVLSQLIQNYPALQQFFNEAPGAMQILLSNLDIKDIDKIKDLYGQFQEQQQQKAQQMAQMQQQLPNPLELKQQELQIKQEGQQQNYEIKQRQVDVEKERQSHDMQKEVIQLVMALMAQNAKFTQDETERLNQMVQIYLKSLDMGHRHGKEKNDNASRQLIDTLKSLMST